MLPLHPVQFSETFARVTYWASCSIRVPYFVINQNLETDEFIVAMIAFDSLEKRASAGMVFDDGIPIAAVPIVPEEVHDMPAYEGGTAERLAHILAMYLGTTPDNIYDPPDKIATYMWDQDGEFRDISIEPGVLNARWSLYDSK